MRHLHEARTTGRVCSGAIIESIFESRPSPRLTTFRIPHSASRTDQVLP